MRFCSIHSGARARRYAGVVLACLSLVAATATVAGAADAVAGGVGGNPPVRASAEPMASTRGFNGMARADAAVEACLVGAWTAVAPATHARSRGALVFTGADRRFYLVGGEGAGSNRDLPIEAYDPVLDSWSDRAALAVGVANTAAAAIGQYVYVAGGYTGTVGVAALQRYDVVGNTVTSMAPMSGPLYAHAAVALGNRLHVLGGSETGIAGSTHRIYNASTNAWSDSTPLPVPVAYATAVTDGTYVYVLGGGSEDFDTVQRFNPATSAWAVISPMGTRRGGASGFYDGRNVWAIGGGWTTYLDSTEFWDGTRWQAGPILTAGMRTAGAAFGDGRALKAGGWDGTYSNHAEVLEIDCPPPPPTEGCSIGAWQPVNALTVARSRLGLAFAPANGRFYAIGGEGLGGDRNLPIEEFDPATGAWVPKSTLLTGVSNAGAAAIGGQVYVPGGYTGSLHVADLQRYDVVSDSVSALAPMPAPNSAHAAVAHAGRLHVLGGSGDGQAGYTHYVFDPAAGSWSDGAPLLRAVRYAAAASDGTYIYLIGGDTTDLITVQRYEPASNLWTEAPIMDTGRGGAGAFFDGTNVWAIGGGWSSYLDRTEYFDGFRWRLGPGLSAGARSLGAAFGAGLALRAGGWSGDYSDTAETLTIACGPEVFADGFESN